ncbi:hypothetical protein GCM10010149_33150 [Nonomuraea roseoviolacea subsp. roseoviolacea]
MTTAFPGQATTRPNERAGKGNPQADARERKPIRKTFGTDDGGGRKANGSGGSGGWGRRSRRRLIAATLAGLAVLLAYAAMRPETSPPILVAARDLRPGVLRPGDVRAVSLTPPPDGALRTGAVGRVLAGPMRRGEPLTDARLLHSLRLPTGTVATPVRIADADVAGLVSPGSTIGVLVAWESQPAQLVADDVMVITVPKPTDDHNALLVLATTPDQAGRLAAAQASGRLSITIKPPADHLTPS